MEMESDARVWLDSVQKELCDSLSGLHMPEPVLKRLQTLHSRKLKRAWSCMSEPELLAVLQSVDQNSLPDPPMAEGKA